MPSVARAYDYTLFGKHTYEVDRQIIHEVLKTTPDAVWAVRENRAFLQRAVRYLTEQCGIRQFIDQGSGLPTQENTHQVAQRHQPGSHVVYTDNDPIVLAHGRALLAEDATTTVITADLANPRETLNNPDVQELIDFSQPVGLLHIPVLHCPKDRDDPGGVVARTLDAFPSGSYVAISHITTHDEWRLDLGPAVVPRPSWIPTRRTRGDRGLARRRQGDAPHPQALGGGRRRRKP